MPDVISRFEGPLPLRAFLPRAAAAIVLSALLIPDAAAQRIGCTVVAFTDPPREELQCSDGLTISAERATDYTLLDANRDGRPEGAALNGRGLLIDLPSRRQRSFRVMTPHAIASVRGTVWAIDVTPNRTSVFVQEGVVAVQRRNTPQTVELRAGDGVDVDAIGQELRVNRWSRERILNLLARFGR